MPTTDSREKKKNQTYKKTLIPVVCAQKPVRALKGLFNSEKDILQASRQEAEVNLFFLVSDFCPYPI